MNLSQRTLSLSPLLAVSLCAHVAFAQGAPPVPSSPPAEGYVGASSTPSAGAAPDQGGDGFCREHWLAMGRCRERSWAGPQIVFGVDLGLAAMNESGPFGFGKGVGGVTDAGPGWGLRAGVDLWPWVGVEARYVGMYNAVQSSVSPAGSAGYLTTGGEAVVRLTAPLPYVHPYVFAGVGYYDSALVGSSSAAAGSVMNSSSEAGVPMGFGFDVPLTWHFSLGAEATYHFLLHESFSSVTTNGIDGGDLSTFDAVLRLRL